MNFASARSERITATISTVVAVAILAGGVTAYQSHNVDVDDVVQLESDFRFQLEVGFRHDNRERANRLGELEKVSQAWEQSPQAPADREKLADWLLEATIRSMPGAVEALPAVPDFGAAETEPAQTETPLQVDEHPALEEQSPDVIVEPTTRESELEPAGPVPTPASPLTIDNSPFGTKPLASALPEQAKPDGLTAVAPPKVNDFGTPTVTPTLPKPAEVFVEPVQVNLSELAARISGYNAGIKELELRLSRLAADDFNTLADQVKELEQLLQDYQFISLYYQTLDNSERRWVPEPRTLTTTLASFQRRIDRSQEALSGDFLGDVDANNKDRFGELRQQVAELASGENR